MASACAPIDRRLPVDCRLLGSASLLAISLCLAHAPAKAEEPHIVFELKGGTVDGRGQPWAFSQPGATFLSVEPETILGGTLGVVLPLSPFPSVSDEWNAGIFARFGRTDEESRYARPAGTLFNIIGGAYATNYPRGSVDHEEEHLIVDFEARRDVGLGGQTGPQLIAIAGIRFGYFSADTDTLLQCLFCPTNYMTEDRNDRFVGVGPRIGFEGSAPLGSGFAFDAAASAAVLIGRRITSAFALDSFGGVDFVHTQDSLDIVSTIDGRLGLNFTPPSGAYRFGFGVEASYWFGVHDQTLFTPGAPPGFFPQESNADRFVLQPYARLTVPLGGSFGAGSAVSTHAPNDEPATVSQRMGPIFEAEFAGGNTRRTGNALNQTPNPADEVDNFDALSGNLLATMPLPGNLLIQGELNGEITPGNAISGNAPSDDSYDGGHAYGGQLAYQRGPLLFAGFAGAGHVDILTEPTNRSHDADFTFFGATGRFLTDLGGIAVQVGGIDSQATDPEVLDDAIFAKATGQLFFNGGRGKLQGDVAFIVGEQDGDSGVGPSPLEIVTWGVELEHQVNLGMPGGSTSVFVAFRNFDVGESSFNGLVERATDQTISGGIRFRLGDVTPFEREAATAPRLPEIGRWIGATPAVD